MDKSSKPGNVDTSPCVLTHNGRLASHGVMGLIKQEYQSSGEGGTRSPPAKSKKAARGLQNGRQGLEMCLSLGFLGILSNFHKINFFDPSTPSMRKGRDGEKKNGGKKRKRRMKIVATTSLPAVNRPNADRWNAACSRQFKGKNRPQSGIRRGKICIAFGVPVPS